MRYIFVIGPVGSDLLVCEKQRIVQTVASTHDMSVLLPMADAVEHRLDDLISKINSATFVLVDLSLERPSCYYELGVVQTLGRPIEIIAEVGTRIHQLENRDIVQFYRGLEHYEALLKTIFARGIQRVTTSKIRTKA